MELMSSNIITIQAYPIKHHAGGRTLTKCNNNNLWWSGMRRRRKFGFKERFQGLEQVIWGIINLYVRGKQILGTFC